MSSRERVISTIERSGIDRVPVGPPFQGYWALAEKSLSVPDSIKNPKLAAEVQFELANKCGFDAIETMWDWLAMVEKIGCKANIPDVGSPSTASHIITDQAVLDSLEIPDPSSDYRAVAASETTRHLIDKFDKEKFLYMTLVSPFTLVGELRGVENLMLDMYDDKSFVDSMLRYATDVLKVYADYLLDTGVDGIILCDPTASADLISKDDFNNFSKSYTREVGKVIRDRDACLLLHICGNTSDRLADIAEIGADVFSLDFLVDLGYAKETIGDRQILLGNVNPAETLFNGTSDEVMTEARACIEKTGGEGLILGAGCDIAPNSPLENIMKLSAAAIEKSV